MSIVFGPVPSRRLGRSLGINNIPSKVCSYSCIYCQVGLTTDISTERKKYYSPKKIYTEVRNRLAELETNNEKIDYLSFVPDGEPTLDINLGKSLRLLQDTGIKTAVFTNSSLLWNKEVRSDLSIADYVSVKIDSVDEITWKKVNHPSSLLDLNKILKGILEFDKSYKGTLVTETMLIGRLNDDEHILQNIAHFISCIEPKTAYLTLPIRPAPVKGIGSPGKEKINSSFRLLKSVYKNFELLNNYEGNDFSTGKDAKDHLLSILAVHPMRKDAIKNYLSKTNTGWDLITRLINEKEILELKYKRKIFFKKAGRNAGKQKIYTS